VAPLSTNLRVLVVNAGSTSTKVSLLEGEHLVHTYAGLDDALKRPPAVDAAAHRVVHGGHRTNSVVIDGEVLAELRGLTELAPLHQPPALDAIDRCRDRMPHVPQVACFDTAFHATLPAAARTYALPARLRDQVRVYGFHGLSYAWASRRVRELAPEASRVVIAHLGGGESLCGVLDGESVITTMGFTPLDGLVMATRCGSIDPGAVLWLAEHTNEDLSRVFEQEGGLLGLCGTGDMRLVLSRSDEAARLALDVYLHRFVTLLGGCVAALGGIDALVFTGGVGEHSATIRSLVAERLDWLGVVVVDSTAEEVTGPGAAVRTFAFEAREDIQAAHEAAQVLSGA
jgi:acetate kinase